MLDSNCIFCKIIQGKIPSKKAFENDHVLAFHDIDPQAPVHIIVVPKDHFNSIHEVPPTKWDIVSNLMKAITAIVEQQNLDSSGYRLVINFGAQGGQAVPHLHVHILSGRTMQWPPG
jgi:histidine triad (HIT) family protein